MKNIAIFIILMLILTPLTGALTRESSVKIDQPNLAFLDVNVNPKNPIVGSEVNLVAEFTNLGTIGTPYSGSLEITRPDGLEDHTIAFAGSPNIVLEPEDIGNFDSSFSPSVPGTYTITFTINSYLEDSDLSNNVIVKRIRVLERQEMPFDDCIIPIDGMVIIGENRVVTFCEGIYNLPRGIKIGSDEVHLDCNQATLTGGLMDGDDVLDLTPMIDIANYNDVTIRNCNLIDNHANIRAFGNNIKLLSNYIDAPEEGYGAIIQGEEISIILNEFHVNLDGGAIGVLANSEDIYIENNNIVADDSLGIGIDIGHIIEGSTGIVNNVFIKRNYIKNTVQGIIIKEPTQNVVIENNNIIDSLNYGIELESSDVTLRNNNLYGSGVYDLYYQAQDDIDASSNFWGNLNINKIKQKIYDNQDNSEFGKVIIKPILRCPIEKPERCSFNAKLEEQEQSDNYYFSRVKVNNNYIRDGDTIIVEKGTTINVELILSVVENTDNVTIKTWTGEIEDSEYLGDVVEGTNYWRSFELNIPEDLEEGNYLFNIEAYDATGFVKKSYNLQIIDNYNFKENDTFEMQPISKMIFDKIVEKFN